MMMMMMEPSFSPASPDEEVDLRQDHADALDEEREADQLREVVGKGQELLDLRGQVLKSDRMRL